MLNYVHQDIQLVKQISGYSLKPSLLEAFPEISMWHESDFV